MTKAAYLMEKVALTLTTYQGAVNKRVLELAKLKNGSLDKTLDETKRNTAERLVNALSEKTLDQIEHTQDLSALRAKRKFPAKDMEKAMAHIDAVDIANSLPVGSWNGPRQALENKVDWLATDLRHKAGNYE